jgi:outer membrane protein
LPNLNAQKFGYIDLSYILGKMPAYAEAQNEINTLAKAWEHEIREMYEGVQNLETKYKAEEVLLTVGMKEDRTYEIDVEKQKLKEYQKKKFLDLKAYIF